MKLIPPTGKRGFLRLLLAIGIFLMLVGGLALFLRAIDSILRLYMTN